MLRGYEDIRKFLLSSKHSVCRKERNEKKSVCDDHEDNVCGANKVVR